MNKQVFAVLAHDSKKEEMIRLVRVFKPGLAETGIVATRVTGQMIHSRVGLSVTLVSSGRQGGDVQIAAMVAAGEVSAVIFLRDPYINFIDVFILTTLLRICDIHEVPLATNPASATALLFQLVQQCELPAPHRIVADYLDEIAAVQD